MGVDWSGRIRSLGASEGRKWSQQQWALLPWASIMLSKKSCCINYLSSHERFSPQVSTKTNEHNHSTSQKHFTCQALCKIISLIHTASREAGTAYYASFIDRAISRDEASVWSSWQPLSSTKQSTGSWAILFLSLLLFPASPLIWVPLKRTDLYGLDLHVMIF